MTLDSDLTRLCGQAHRQAVTRNEPVLVCHTEKSNGEDPLSMLERRERFVNTGSFRFVWERPKDRWALVASGAARRFVTDGGQRFQDMTEQVETALKETVRDDAGDSNPGAPFALGGFAFFDRVDPAHWPGFGAAQMVIPSWLMVRDGEKSHVCVCAEVNPADDPLAVAAGLAESINPRNGKNGGREETALPGNGAGVSTGASLRREWDVEGHRHWLEMVRRAIEGIEAGRFSKVVLARAVDVFRKRMPSPYAMLRNLRAAYPGCFSFWVDPGEGQYFLGATPERLARLKNGVVRLGAMAGSGPRGDRPSADEALGQRLLDTPKERAEHAIVVESILRAVAPFGGKLEHPDVPQLVKLTNVQHLYTPITLRLAESISLLALVSRLHPTPAVGGFPTDPALSLIRDEENFDRGWYAGPLGWLNATGAGEFAVALRSGAFRDEKAKLFAGAGIVAGSDPEMEYFETQLKLQPMMAALAHE